MALTFFEKVLFLFSFKRPFQSWQVVGGGVDFSEKGVDFSEKVALQISVRCNDCLSACRVFAFFMAETARSAYWECDFNRRSKKSPPRESVVHEGEIRSVL